MKVMIALWFAICSSCLMIACTIGNGQICGPQTPAAYCDKIAYERLKYPKPYGAHWIKDGMIRKAEEKI